MKKILVLSSFPAPYRIDVFKGLSEYYEMDVIFNATSDQNRNSKYFVGQDTFKYYLIGKDDEKIKELVKHLKDYYLVLGYDWYLPYALKIEEKCIRSKIPFIVNCDGALTPNDKSLKSKIKAVIKRRYITKACACMSSGRFATDYFMIYGAKKENIYLHNFSSLSRSELIAIDKEVYDKERFDKDEIRSELGLARKKTVLSIGQFIPRKGFDVLLESWRELDEDYQLVIVGGGDDQPQYEKIIADKGYKNVVLVPFKPKEIIARYYMASDLFVLPTREDIWGLVINEAMAYSLPVISTNQCVAAMELIENGQGGYIVDSDAPDALNEKMKTVLEGDMQLMGRINRKAIDCYTIEDIVESHVQVLRQFE